MIKVKFKWISRAKYNALASKDDNTLYFIYNEHVLYKGTQMYGGVQTISYTTDTDGNYVVTITNGDGTTSELLVAKSTKLQQAIEDLQAHIDTKATESISAHTKLTDTINTTTPQQVSDNVAATPKSVVDYISNYDFQAFQKYPSRRQFPIVGSETTLYLSNLSGYLYIYENSTGGYRLISDNWRNIREIHAIIH